MLQIITILQNKADKHQHNVQRSEVKWYHSNFYRRIWYYYYYNVDSLSNHFMELQTYVDSFQNQKF